MNYLLDLFEKHGGLFICVKNSFVIENIWLASYLIARHWWMRGKYGCLPS